MSNGHSCGNISGIVPQNCKAYNFSLGYHKSIFFDITLNSTSSSTNTSFESYDDFFRREEDFNPYVSTHYISDQQLYVIFKNVNISDFSKPYTNCVNKIISDSVIIFKPKDVSSIMIFPKIERHYISNHWGFRSYEETCYLNYAIKSLPKLNNEGNIQFSVNVFNQLTYETEINEYTFGNAIANLGGFYVALNSMYVLLFGMPKLSPWYELFNRTLNDALPNSSSLIFVHSQGLKAKLAKRYVTSSGIVLAQRVSNRRNNATLENRVQMLETMLQDYYLDNYQFEASFLMMHLRRMDLKYDKLQCEYDEMINSRHQGTEEERIFLG
ncbi:4705_t:CDS:2 [Entrophospora sp. SA101]|nr:4705_t:CDS:2 [Entrophospora sp. SA101]CAJ0859267.1 21068_t:CDS:2 [Entrophospora sp. SA101]CAJ0859313.1 21072_t:CDS:2 [Entrophospora sp. SA101]CAJ0908279.1 10046_t:CDS:2 [Entrophospora sp. SA101]